MDIRRLSTPLTQADKLAVVSIDEAKAQARVTTSAEDVLIAEHVEAAYDFLAGDRGWLGRCCLLREKFQYFVPAGPRLGPGYDYPGSGFGPVGSVQAGMPRQHWNGQSFELPMRPVRSESDLIAFEVLQGDGSYAAMLPSYWHLVLSEDGFARIERAVSGFPWPYFGYYSPKAYRVTFQAGFGTKQADVPAPIRQAIKLLVADLYNNREDSTMQPTERVLNGLRRLAGIYRFEPDHS